MWCVCMREREKIVRVYSSSIARSCKYILLALLHQAVLREKQKFDECEKLQEALNKLINDAGAATAQQVPIF